MITQTFYLFNKAAFTIKTTVIAAQWPGATLTDTVNLVTDTLEKKLQEIPGLDYIESETRAGQSFIYVNLRDDTPPEKVPDIMVSGAQKNAGYRPHTATRRFGPQR